MIRRKYEVGTPCQDCGRLRPTTQITFWVNGMAYIVCGECIRAYRDRTLKPSREQNARTFPKR